MAQEDFRLEVVGHAAVLIASGGKTLLTDPWLVDPMGHSGFHYPPLVHRPEELAQRTDAIYISHIHPDHFHPPSLRFFSRRTPIYIGEYGLKGFREEVRRLGFPVFEVPFQVPTRIEGTDFEITLIEHDYEESAAYDSAIVVATPRFTLFENNDCFLRPEKYRWVRQRFEIEYALLGYSPASFFPISFEMDEHEKQRLLAASGERRYNDFVQAAEILQAQLSIPFASGARFLRAGAVWKNVSFNSASEAVRRLQRLDLHGEVLGPGDRILADGSIDRVSPVLDRDGELRAIEEYAQRVQDWVARTVESGVTPRADLVARFREYILDLWRQTRDKLPGIDSQVIAYRILGSDDDFYFDFSRPEDQIFQWGVPAHYDMRYTYPASALQARLDGEIDWDSLHFTDEVSVHQVRYAREFYTMLRSEMLEIG